MPGRESQASEKHQKVPTRSKLEGNVGVKARVEDRASVVLTQDRVGNLYSQFSIILEFS